LRNLVVHVVDDTRTFLVAVRQKLLAANESLEGEASFFRVETFSSPEAWLAGLSSQTQEPDLCLFDISMHGDDEAGLTLAGQAKERLPLTVVVMYSQFDDADTILKLMDAGADSFISKRTPLDDLSRELQQAYSVALRKRPTRVALPSGALNHVCVGQTMENIAARVPGLLNSAVRALHVEGETGTGKEVVADLIALALEKASRHTPFVRVNCGALSATLLESELFGHRKGAFTGATTDKEGLLEAAQGGWIFLDEVACLSMPAQISLLRVIENQELLRVGDTKPRRLDVRVLSACNENLQTKVADGAFRRDLWQRLTEACLSLPPLRERKGEVEPLAQFFCRSLSGGPYHLSPAALELLCRSPWREGNVRQLRNCLRAMTEYSESNVLGPNSIPREIFASIGRAETPKPEDSRTRTPQLEPMTQEPAAREGFLMLEGHDVPKLERKLFAAVLKTLFASEGRHATWTLRSLAARTGLSRMTLSRRLDDALECGELVSSELPKSFQRKTTRRKQRKGFSK
jgi:DNA-binding NtrC family response regulator